MYTVICRQLANLNISPSPDLGASTHPIQPVRRLRLIALAFRDLSYAYTPPPTSTTTPSRRVHFPGRGGGFAVGGGICECADRRLILDALLRRSPWIVVDDLGMLLSRRSPANEWGVNDGQGREMERVGEIEDC